MLWSNKGRPPRPRPATFADVTPEERKAPSWLAPAPPSRPRTEAPMPRPPRVPTGTHSIEPPLPKPVVLSTPPDTSLLALDMAPPLESLRVPSLPSAPPAPPPGPPPELVAAFGAALEQLAAARMRVLDETRAQLAELATLIARRVIGRELSTDPRLVLGLVQEGLDALGQYDRVIVRIGSFFESTRDELATRLQGTGVSVEIVLDPALPPDGCLVETEFGRVDESLETRLDHLLRGLASEEPPAR